MTQDFSDSISVPDFLADYKSLLYRVKSTAALFASVINNIYKGVITSFSELVNFKIERDLFRHILSVSTNIFFSLGQALPQRVQAGRHRHGCHFPREKSTFRPGGQ